MLTPRNRWKVFIDYKGVEEVEGRAHEPQRAGNQSAGQRPCRLHHSHQSMLTNCVLCRVRPDQAIHLMQHMRHCIDEKVLTCIEPKSNRRRTCNKGKLLLSAHVAGRFGSVPLMLKDTRESRHPREFQ